MSGRSDIHARTLEAYRQTDYHVFAEPPFTLRVGEVCLGLRAAHSRYGVECSAFVSACNPMSRALQRASNAARHRALIEQLAQRNVAFLQGEGRHPSNGWPAEPSVLVFGLTRAAARALGTRLHQNAVLWCGADARVVLVLLR